MPYFLVSTTTDAKQVKMDNEHIATITPSVHLYANSKVHAARLATQVLTPGIGGKLIVRQTKTGDATTYILGLNEKEEL